MDEQWIAAVMQQGSTRAEAIEIINRVIASREAEKKLHPLRWPYGMD